MVTRTKIYFDDEQRPPSEPKRIVYKTIPFNHHFFFEPRLSPTAFQEHTQILYTLMSH